MTQDIGDNTFHNADNCDCVRCNPELKAKPPKALLGVDSMSESPEDCYDLVSDDDICQRCSGLGSYHDCGEDTCCCADTDDPEDLVMCPDCKGEGILR